MYLRRASAGIGCIVIGSEPPAGAGTGGRFPDPMKIGMFIAIVTPMLGTTAN